MAAIKAMTFICILAGLQAFGGRAFGGRGAGAIGGPFFARYLGRRVRSVCGVLQARGMNLEATDDSIITQQLQSKIRAVENSIAEVSAQIVETAASIKLVQDQILDVSAKIEVIEAKFELPNLPIDQKELLKMELKRQIGKEAPLMIEKAKLMIENAKLMDKEAKLMDMEAQLNLNSLARPKLQWEADRTNLGPVVSWSSLSLGDVVTVNMAHSGLKGKDDPFQKLYVRRACLDLFKFLSETPQNMLLVTGCPGVGKSVEVFSFALEQAQLHKKRVLYIHADIKSGISVVFKEDPNVDTARVGRHEFSDAPEALSLFVDNVLREDLVDLIVLDGALPRLILKVFLKMDEYPSVKLVTCTSFQAPGKLSQEASMKCAPRARFIMDSWREDELYAALDAGALSLPPGTTRSEKFFYSGGSVRLFLVSIEEVKTEIEIRISKVPDIGKIVGRGGIGDSSEDAANSLMAIYDGISVVLSQFALRSMMERIADYFIQKARQFLPDNPVWLGWLFEAEVMFAARRQKNLTFRNDSSVPSSIEMWEAPPGLTLFENVTDLAPKCSKIGWYQPTLWNQKGYDALFLVSSDKLRIVQISTSLKSRKFDLKDAIPLAKATNTHEIEVVLICGTKTFGEVEISESESELESEYGKINSHAALETVLNEIAAAKAKAFPHIKKERRANINFRTVCYECDLE